MVVAGSAPPVPLAVPVVAVAGWSGAGATTLVLGLQRVAAATVQGLERAAAHGPVRGPAYDLPGDPVLLDAGAPGVAAADLLVLVVSAVDGLDPGSVATWRAAEDAGLPRLVAVTKADLPGADLDESLALCRRLLGPGQGSDAGEELQPLAMPLHGGDPEAPGGVDGLLDLVTVRVLDHSGPPGWQPVVTSATGEFLDAAAGQRDELIEAVLTASEDATLLDAWLLGIEPSPTVLGAELAIAVAGGLLHPVVAVSGVTGLGCPSLLALLRSLPLAVATGPVLDAGPDAPLVLSALGDGVVRVRSGTLRPGVLGRTLTDLAGAPVGWAGPGVVVVVPGLDVAPGAVLGPGAG